MPQINTKKRLLGYKKQRVTRRKNHLKKYGSILRYKQLVNEYDDINELPAKEIPINHNHLVWWKCIECDHRWEAKPRVRTKFNLVKKIKLFTECPKCKKKKSSIGYKFPELAKEWDYKKNELTPYDVPYHDKEKRYWICLKHGSYPQAPNARTGNQEQGCPKCTRSTSRPEFRVFSEFINIFNKVSRNIRFKGKEFRFKEIDIFLNDYKFGIEIDGHYHKDYKKDLEKNKFFNKLNIFILRVREPNLKKIINEDLIYDGRSLKIEDLKKILNVIKTKRSLLPNELKKLNKYLKLDKFQNEKKYKLLCKNLPFPPTEDSILKTHPEIIKSWDYKKNKPLTPEIFTKGSADKVWWKCNNHSYEHPKVLKLYQKSSFLVKKHNSFEMSISDRTSGHDCYDCGRIKTLIKQLQKTISNFGSLADYSYLIKEIKNKNIRNKVRELSKEIPASSKMVLEWYCKKHKHSWKNSIVRRIFGFTTKEKKGMKCKFCGNKKKI